jgi:hypothetical protein
VREWTNTIRAAVQRTIFQAQVITREDEMRKRDDDQYREQEEQQRFDVAISDARIAGVKPLKGVTPKGVPAQSKKQPKSSRRGA